VRKCVSVDVCLCEREIKCTETVLCMCAFVSRDRYVHVREFVRK
jgi:hypothetical protein